MFSYTKKKVTKYEAKALFEGSGVGTVEAIKEVDSGEFSTVYQVKSNGAKYFIKFSADPEARVLTYEKGIMKTELGINKLFEGTEVKAPKIVFSDTSKEKINVCYFISEGYDATMRQMNYPTVKDRKRVKYQLGAAMAEYHKIKGTGYGYEQLGLETTWADAYKKMVDKIIADATILGVKLDTFRIYNIIERAQVLFKDVESTLVHFDVWTGNAFVNRKNYTFQGFIDWERAYWGDFAGDFISVKPLGNIEANRYFIKGYRSVSPLEFDFVLRMRMELARMYLGMVQKVEASVRFPKGSAPYTFRRYYGKRLMNKAMKALERPILNEFIEAKKPVAEPKKEENE